MANTSGLVAIICLHTDFFAFFYSFCWVSLYEENLDEYSDNSWRIMSIWKTLAELFKDYSQDKIAFDLISELRFDDLDNAGETEKACNMIMELFKRLINTIRSVGDCNTDRFILVSGYYNKYKTYKDYIIEPFMKNFDEYCILTTNYYEPWQFCNASATDEWGSEEELLTVETDLKELGDLLASGVPIIINEYGVGSSDVASMKAKEPYIIKYIYHITKAIVANNMASFLWDPGYILSRETLEYSIKCLIPMYEAIRGGNDFDIKPYTNLE